MKKKQQGFSFLSVVIIGVLLALAGIVGAQVFPTVVEYQAIQKAVNRAAEFSTVNEVRSAFDRSSAIDDIKSISSKDLELTRENDRLVVSFAYEREIHLAGPAYLVLKYAGSSK